MNDHFLRNGFPVGFFSSTTKGLVINKSFRVQCLFLDPSVDAMLKIPFNRNGWFDDVFRDVRLELSPAVCLLKCSMFGKIRRPKRDEFLKYHSNLRCSGFTKEKKYENNTIEGINSRQFIATSSRSHPKRIQPG